MMLKAGFHLVATTLLAGVIDVDADEVQEAEKEPVPEASDEARKILKKLGFPEAEGDLAPSAMLPAAVKCVQKLLPKLDSLLVDIMTVEKSGTLTSVQMRSGPQT